MVLRVSASKNVSLRASAHTGVATPRIFKHFQLIVQRFLFYLGDRQKVNCPEGAREATLGCTSLRTGSR